MHDSCSCIAVDVNCAASRRLAAWEISTVTVIKLYTCFQYTSDLVAIADEGEVVRNNHTNNADRCFLNRVVIKFVSDIYQSLVVSRNHTLPSLRCLSSLSSKPCGCNGTIVPLSRSTYGRHLSQVSLKECNRFLSGLVLCVLPSSCWSVEVDAVVVVGGGCDSLVGELVGDIFASCLFNEAACAVGLICVRCIVFGLTRTKFVNSRLSR